MAAGESTARERKKGRGKVAKERGADPELESVVGDGGGGTEMPESRPVSDGRRRRRTGRRRQLRASRTDSNGGEGAEDAADLLVRFDPTGEYRSDGGMLDTDTAMEGLGRAKNSVDPEN